MRASRMTTTNRPRDASPASARETTADGTALPADELFHVLQTFRRREAIRYLLGESGPVKMPAVAEHVAAVEHETTVAELTSEQRQRVYIPLYQSHLPKLDELGVIEYDKPRGIVRPTEDLECFRPYLDSLASETDDTDSSAETTSSREKEYYGTALAAATGLVVAGTLGAVPLSDVMLGAMVTAAFTLAVVASVLTRSATGVPL